MNLHEPLRQLYSRSQLLVLDFDQIAASTPEDENIERYFAQCIEQRIDPRSPANRQSFHNSVLQKNHKRYLVGRYGEDRRAMLAGSSIADEGRTIHLGIDFFCKDQEIVYAPCNGTIVRVGHEPGSHSFGYYVILAPSALPGTYIFFGHLSSRLPKERTRVTIDQPIARLGDSTNDENGGWSRHLHMQILTGLPVPGTVPIGYSSSQNFAVNSHLFPDPSVYFEQRFEY